MIETSKHSIIYFANFNFILSFDFSTFNIYILRKFFRNICCYFIILLKKILENIPRKFVELLVKNYFTRILI